MHNSVNTFLHAHASVSRLCTLCPPVLIGITSELKCVFGMPFKVLTKQVGLYVHMYVRRIIIHIVYVSMYVHMYACVLSYSCMFVYAVHQYLRGLLIADF